MITIKTNWLIGSITAIVLLFGVYFMVNAMEKKSVEVDKPNSKADEQEWFFTGGPGDNPLLAENYSEEQDEDKPCNNTPQVICKIVAPEQGGLPQMTPYVQSQITAANTSKTANDVVESFRSN